MLADRPVVVLATWDPPALQGGLETVMDALYETHADLRAAEEAARAACDVLDAQGLHGTPRVCPDERSA